MKISVTDSNSTYEALSSRAANCDGQVAWNVLGDGDGCDLAQLKADYRGRADSGYAEAERMEFEGGGEGDTSC